MKIKGFLSDSFMSILKLNLQFRYQLLFVLSNMLYHSYDFVIYASLEEAQEKSGSLEIINIIQDKIFQIGINLIAMLINIYVTIQLFVFKNNTYLIELQQKIIFPVLVFVLTQIIASDSSNLKQDNFTQMICLRVIFSISSIFTFILVWITNFRLNLRYAESLSKGLNRLWIGQYFLMLLKMGVTFIFTSFFLEKRVISLFILVGINILMNIAFKIKIFYEHPSIEYLSAINQFYIWIPTFCGVLQYNGLDSVSIWITYFVGLAMYLLVSLKKPRIIMFYLEKKYLKNILVFSNHLQTYNNKDNLQLSGYEESPICYLSIARNLILDYDNNQLSWSSNFIAQVIQILKSDSVILSKLFERQQISQKAVKTHKYIKDQKLVEHDNFWSPQRQFEVKFYGNMNQKVRIQFFERIASVLSELLVKCPGQNRILLYFCYNFPDYSNKMKHRMFYYYFLSLENVRNIFDSVECQICYKYLLGKIGSQKKRTSQVQTSSHFLQALAKSNNKDGLALDLATFVVQQKFENKQHCFSQISSYFNSKFNDLIHQNSLYFQLLQQINNFTKNQQLYVDIKSSANDYKSQIRKYFRNRNQIFKSIQQTIEQYSGLKQSSKRFYLLIIFRYISDFYLKNDPLIAYDKFTQTLQYLSKSFHPKKIDFFCQQYSYNNDVNNILCVISGVKDPDTIVASCSEFKKLLEIQDQSKFFNSKAKKTKITTAQIPSNKQNVYKIKLNHFILPLWKEKHQKLLETRFIDGPVNHQTKRYFLSSKKQTNVLQIKCKMHFHMLYENDLLIVLDIQQKSLRTLQIINKQKNHILYSHRKQSPQQKPSIYSERGTRNALNTVLDDKIRERINQLNNFFVPKPSEQIQQIQLFGTQYHIVSMIASQEINMIQQMVELKAKSIIHFEETLHNDEKYKIQQQRKQKQRKYYKGKRAFTFQRTLMWFTFIFYLVSIGFIVFLLNLYQKNQVKILSTLVNGLNDKILIEDQYSRDQFYRTIDIGMFSNMYQQQLNVALISTQQRTVLFSRILNSVKASLERMKQRHAIVPQNIQKGLRSEMLYDPYWISGYNISFEMMIFHSQIKYIDALKSFTKLSETYSLSNNSKISQRQVNFEISLPKDLLSSMRLYINGLYLKSVLENKDYIFNRSRGVFPQILKQNQQMFIKLEKYQVQRMSVFLSLVIVSSTLSILLILFLVYKMNARYLVAINTSDKFIEQFKSNVKKLKICVEELTKFSKHSMFYIVKLNEFNFREAKIGKCSTIKFNNNTKKINHRFNQQLNLINPTLKNNKDKSQDPKINDKKIRISQKVNTLKSFYAQKLIFPLIKLIVLFTIFFFVFQQGWTYNKTLQTYANGLTQLTEVNMALLNLFTTNLFIANFRKFQQAINSSITATSLETQFSDTIAKVSSIDKINIVTSLFINDPNKDDIISKILYRPLCTTFPNQMQCPQYMVPKVNGLYEKYGQVIKNFNVLFHHLTNAKTTPLGNLLFNSGILNTTAFQHRYMESYESLEQLMYISKQIKTMSFERLKSFLPLDADDNSTMQKNYSLLYCLALYLIIDAVFTITKIYNEVKVIQEEFLRIGNYSMFEGEKVIFDGYNKFVNVVQQKEWIPDDT